MTYPDATFDISELAPPNVPQRPGIWRALSLLAVVAAVVITVVSVFQARAASDVAAADQVAASLETSRVTSGDLAVPASPEIAVLGLADAQSRQPFDPAGTDLPLPRGRTAIIALLDADAGGEIVGLAVGRGGTDRSAIELSARSTAQALLVLSPAALRPNLDETFAQVEVVENDESFTTLVQAVQANSRIAADNEALEAAYAAIADRIQVKSPAPDQGCDSVSALDSYAAAGACVQTSDAGLTITNEQDRWALVYSGANDFAELCAVVAPTGTLGDEVLVSRADCSGDSLLVAPGPVTTLGQNQDILEQRVRIASALNMLYGYSGPFADLAGGSAGFSTSSNSHLRQNSQDVVAVLARLVADEEFAAAVDVPLRASTAVDRHFSAASATRSIIEEADSTNLIPERTPGDTGHLALLEFYQRSGERLTSERTAWRWEADAIGMIDFGDNT